MSSGPETWPTLETTAKGQRPKQHSDGIVQDRKRESDAHKNQEERKKDDPPGGRFNIYPKMQPRENGRIHVGFTASSLAYGEVDP